MFYEYEKEIKVCMRTESVIRCNGIVIIVIVKLRKSYDSTF